MGAKTQDAGVQGTEGCERKGRKEEEERFCEVEKDKKTHLHCKSV
jgi:hypothetical protein